MAKAKQEVNKSELIRELIAANPELKAQEAVDAMKSKGHEITAGLFYAVKNKMNGDKKPAKSKGKKPAPAADMVSMAAVKKVQALANEYGMEQVSAIVAALK